MHHDALFSRPLPLKDQVYHSVRERLRAGDLSADDRLVDAVLAKEMSISRTPVREALQLLVHERLLESTTRGFKLGVLSPEEVHDLFELRLLLEPQVARKAAEKHDKAKAQALLDCVKQARAALAPDALGQFNAAVYSFFEQLLGLCDNLAMVRSVQLYHDRLAQLRVPMMAPTENRKLATKGFADIARAIKAGDPDKAEQASFDHISAGIRVVEKLGLTFPRATSI